VIEQNVVRCDSLRLRSTCSQMLLSVIKRSLYLVQGLLDILLCLGKGFLDVLVTQVNP
jgi:hypothetical protein